MTHAYQPVSVIELQGLPATSGSREGCHAEDQCQQLSEASSETNVTHFVPPTSSNGEQHINIVVNFPEPGSEVTSTKGKVTVPNFTLSDWWWELFSWAIGTLSLLAMVLLLAFFNDKAITTWHSKLSINAIVSALAQTSQSSFAVSLSSGIGQLKWDWLRTRRQKSDIDTFDLASRGPLGSVGLVWKQCFGHMKLHTATIGALTTVLLIAFSTFSQQAINVDERTMQSRIGARIGRANNFTMSSNQSISQEIIHGAMEGLSRDNITFSEVQGQCAGEKCEWEKYSSLAICAYTSLPGLNATFNCTANLNDTITLCLLNDGVDPDYSLRYLQAIANIAYNEKITFLVFSPNGPEVKDTTDIYISMVLQDTIGSRTPETNIPISFLKVTFELCVHTYRTVIQEQRTRTKLLHQGPALTKDPNWRWTPERGLPHYFSCGTAEDISACVNTTNTYDSTRLLTYLAGEVLNERRIKEEVMGKNGFERMAARMNNVAISMTNGMRQSLQSAEMIDGTVERSLPYFRVSIAWLILPVAIWLCTSFFLLFAIQSTKRHGVPVWKSSPLILLDCKQKDGQLGSDRLVREREKRQPAMVVLEDGRLVETR